MNPLTFEIQIGNKLNEDIKKYKALLESLLTDKTVTIGVDSKLSTIVEQLVNGFKEVNNAQKEAGGALKGMTQQMEAQKKLADDVTAAIKAQTAAQRELSTAQQEARTGTKGKQGDLFDVSAVEGLKNELMQYAGQIDKIIAQIQAAVNNMGKGIDVDAALKNFRDGVRGLAEAMAPFQRALQTLSQYGGDFQKATDVMVNASQQLQKSLTDLSNAQKEAGGGQNTKQKIISEVEAYMRLQNALNQVTMALDVMYKTQGQLTALGTDSAKVDNYIQQLKDLKAALTEATKGNGTADVENIKLLDSRLQSVIQSARSYAAEELNVAKSINIAKIAVKELDAQVEKLTEAEARARNFNVDTTSLSAARQRVEELRDAMKELTHKGGEANFGGLTFRSASDLKRSAEAQEAVRNATQQHAKALAEIKNASKSAAQGVSALSQEEQKLAQAFNNTTREARNQSQVVSDLKSLMMQYFSVYGAQQFLTQMVQVTGELELQRRSLEVILGSGTAASEMYYQLRDLSQQSPYTFQDLLKAHRQLAAFGIEAKNIYGTMKSLTDIGAGLDVPVERLILAYGHTRSYGYLSGIQNRQFETAGIDMIGGLMDLYNRRADEAKRNGQTANYTSRKDIFARMRKRDIPFEDVEEVIMDLDRPGGRFYNMQERQYNTIGGKLRNLRNNWNIMLSEMGGSNRGLLTGILDTINNVTANWEKYANALKSVAAAYVLLKVTQMATGKAMIAQNAAIMASTNKLQTSVRGTNFLNNVIGPRGWGYWTGLNASSYTRWKDNTKTTFGVSGNASRRQLAMNRAMQVKEITNNEKLTNLQKQRIALTEKLTVAQRRRLLVATGLSRQQALAVARLGSFRRGLLSLRLGFIQAAASARAFMASILPQAGFMIAIGATVSLIGRALEQSRKAKQMAEDFRDQSATNRKTAEEILQNYVDRQLIDLDTQTKYDTLGRRIDKNRITFRNLDGVNLGTEIEELKKKLQVLSPMYEGDLFDIEKLATQEEQFEALVNKIETIRRANQVQESISQRLANADKHVAGNYILTSMFGDTFSEDMQDYQKRVEKMDETLQKLSTDTDSDYYTSDRDLEKINRATGGMLKAIKEEYGLSDYRQALSVYFRKMAQMEESERNKALGKLEGVRLRGGLRANGLYNKVAVNGLSRTLTDQYEQLKKDAEKWIPDLGYSVVKQFATDPDGAVVTMMNEVNSFLASAGVTDPEVKQEIINVIIEKLKENGSFTVTDKNTGLIRNIGDIYAEAIAKDQFAQYLGGLKEGMSDDAANKEFEGALKKIQGFIKRNNYTFTQLGQDNGRAWARGLFDARRKELENASTWQKRARKVLTIDAKLKTSIDTSVDVYALAEEVQKSLKEARDRIQKAIPHIKSLQVRLGVEFNLSATTSVEEIRKQRNKLSSKIDENVRAFARGTLRNRKFADTGEGKSLQWRIDLEKELLGEYDAFMKDLGVNKEGKDWLKSEGFKDEDQEKRDKAAEKAKSEREKKWRNEDRDLIKNLQSRQKNLQEAYRTYWAWYDKLGQDEQAAMTKVRKKFTDAQISDEDLKNLQSQEGYIQLLNKFIDEVDKTAKRLHYQKENKDTIENIKVNAAGTIDQTEQKQFDDATKNYTSELDRQVKLLGEQYDLYKKIYELTGNSDLARSLSGLTATSTTSKADALRGRLEQDALDLLSKSINFSDVADMDDEKIEKYVGQLVNKDANGNERSKEELDKLQPRIDSIVNALKQWRDLEREIRNEGTLATAQAIGSLQDYESVVSRNNAELADRIDKINKGEGTDAEKQRAIGIVTLETGTKNLQASAGYYELMNNSSAMSENWFARSYKEAIDNLNERFKAGVISVQDYVKEEEKLRKIRQDYDNKGLFGKDTQTTAFLQGGLSGLNDWLNRHIESRETELGNNKDAIANDEQIKKWRKLQEQITTLQGNLASLSTVVGVVTGLFNGLQEAASDLSKMFDALGSEGDAEFWSDTADTISAVSSVLAPVDNIVKNAMSGNVGGMVSSAISAPVSMITSPVTAFAQLHDKKRQRAIDKLQEDVSKIEGTLNIIKELRQYELGIGSSSGNSIMQQIRRTFGYGSTTGSAAGAIANNFYGTEGADNAMSQYYDRLGYGNSYEQEYNKLVAEREDYVKMYDKEASKKKSSTSALEEYKQKIAELDIQIVMFSENMANELYGINFKDWSSQLSDALVTAFENGESAADAFEDTVTSILQNLAKQIINVGVMEPLFQQLRNNLFGYTDENGKVHKGSFNISDPEGSMSSWMGDINEAFGENGYISKGVSASEYLFNALEQQANKYGNTLLSNDSGSTSSSIKSITEESANLLAAYMNAIRADVSVQRQLLSNKVVPYMESMSEIAQAQVQYQSQIAQNTLRNAQAAEMIAQSNADMLYLFNAIVNNTKQVNVIAK